MPERNVTYARSTDMSQRTVGGRYHLWMKPQPPREIPPTRPKATTTKRNRTQTVETELDRFQTSILVNMTDTVSLSGMLRSVHCLRAMNSDIFWLTQEHVKTLPSMGILLDRLIPQKENLYLVFKGTHSKYMESNLPKLKSGT